ncbi:MAG: hypothetical protein U0872_00395 [Planctomycetaceae bacterium]
MTGLKAERDKADRDRRHQELAAQFGSPVEATARQAEGGIHGVGGAKSADLSCLGRNHRQRVETDGAASSEIRLGDYRVKVVDLTEPGESAGQIIPFPGCFPFPDAPSLLIKAEGTGRDEAVEVPKVAMCAFSRSCLRATSGSRSATCRRPW